MSKSKLTINLEQGECCLVVPTEWAKHVVEAYKDMAIHADTNADSVAFQEFYHLVETWIEETAVEYHD